MCREATSISEPMMLLWLTSMSSVTSSVVGSCLQSALKANQSAMRWSHLGTKDSSVETASSMVMRMGEWSLPMGSSGTVQVHLYEMKNEAYGGVGLFLNEMLISSFEIVSFPVDELIMETLFVNISLGNRSLIVGVLYRPPNTDLHIFNSAFDNLLMRLA